jgi:adenylate cyclase
VVGIDVSLDVATDEDTALADAIKKFSDGALSRVVTVGDMPESGPLADPALRTRTVSGVAEAVPDADGLIRRAPLAVRRGTAVEPSFALAVVSRFQGLDRAAIKVALESRGAVELPQWRTKASERIGSSPVTVVPDAPARINLVGPAGTFLSIPSRTVADLAEPGAKVPPGNPLRGSIVLIGGTFTEGRDIHPTPHGHLAGVEIHANLVQMLGTRTFLQPSSWFAALAVQLAFVAVAAVLLVVLSPMMGTIVTLAGGVLVGPPMSYLVFAHGQHWIDFMLPIFALRVMGWGVDFVNKRIVRDAVRRSLGAWTFGATAVPTPGLRSERVDATILAVRARGFASEADKESPHHLATRLVAYREVVRSAVTAQDGTVHNGLDDAVVAVFGATAPGPDHEARAVRAARAIVAAVRELNGRWLAEGSAPLRVVTALDTGTVVASRPEGAPRGSYAVIGAPVERVRELTRLTASPDGAILVTLATVTALGDGVTARPFATVTTQEGDLAAYELSETEMPVEGDGR